jgi:hypothetical protein
VWLRIENKTDIPFFLYAGRMSIFGNVTAKQVCTLGSGCDAIPDVIDVTKGDICFYYIIDDDKPVNSEYKLIKRISNLASVITLIEDNRDGDYIGDIGYGIIVTNEMLGITANSVDGVQVEYEDNAGDDETPEASAENEDEADVII